MPLARYLAADDSEREGAEPSSHFAGENRRHLIAMVSKEMVRMAAERAGIWAWLRSLAAPAARPTDAQAPQPETTQPPPPPPAAAAAAASAHEALAERLLQLSGFSADPEFFKRSLRDFVVERNVESSNDDSAGDN